MTFEIDAGQWVSFGKEKALFPFNGTLPQDGRWKENNRPFPTSDNPKYVSVIGFLTGILTEEGHKRFTVNIHSIHFLGTAPQTFPKSMWAARFFLPPLTSFITALTPTPKGKRKAGLDFEDTPSKKAK